MVPWTIRKYWIRWKNFLGKRSINRWVRFGSEDEMNRRTNRRISLLSRQYTVSPWGTTTVDYSDPDFGIQMWWDDFVEALVHQGVRARALDLGPNLSWLPSVLREKGSFTSACIDYSPGVVAIQALRGNDSRFGDYTAMPLDTWFGSEKFDLITCKGAINLDEISNLTGFLRSAKAQLAEGGLLLVTPTNSDHDGSGKYRFQLSNYATGLQRRTFLEEGFEEITVPGLNTPDWKFPVTLCYGSLDLLQSFGKLQHLGS